MQFVMPTTVISAMPIGGPSPIVVQAAVQGSSEAPKSAATVQSVPRVWPFMNAPMPFNNVPALAPMTHWFASSPIVGATWPLFAPSHFHAFPSSSVPTTSSSSTVRPTTTKIGSGSATAGQPVIHGAFPWPDPYLMARAVPGMGRQGASICMPELHSGNAAPGPVAPPSCAEPSPYTTRQACPASLPRNEAPSLYNTIPKAQVSDSTPPYQAAPSNTSFSPYSAGSNSGSQVEISSPAPAKTVTSPAPEEEVPVQFNKVEAKPARQVMNSMVPEIGAPEPAPQEPREAGVGLMFVIATAPKKGWAVKTVIKQSPADLSGKIQEGHVLTAVDGKPVTELRSLNELSKMLMGLEGTSISLSFKVGSGKKAKTYHVTLVRSNAFLGEDGNNKERQWKATRTDWIDPDAQAVEI